MRLKYLMLAISLSTVGVLNATAAQAESVEPVTSTAVQRLSTRLAAMSSLQGLFVQTQYDLEGELLLSSSGDFAMARPGKLAWNTLEPFPQKLITDGETLWLYDPDLEQVSVRSLGDSLKQTPAAIIAGDLSQIKTDFDVTQTLRGPENVFELRPKRESEFFQLLTLSFSDGQLTTMELLDGFGQDTKFSLSAVTRNQPLAADLFNFVAPAGTDVLINE